MASPSSVRWEVAGGGSPPAPSGRKKRTRAVADSRCQVEGCGADLSAGKSYHLRHRVCEDHSKSSSVVVAGRTQRFCQQCSRFHDLGEFDEDKRSCRRRLAGHNQRRRKPTPNLTSSIHYPAQFAAASSYYYGGQLATGLAIDRPLSHFNSAKPTRIDGCDAFISQEAAAAPGLVMPFNSNPSMLSLHPASSGSCVRMPYGYYKEPVGQIFSIQNGFSDDGFDAGKLSSTSDSERALCLLSKGWNNVVTNNALSTNQAIGENKKWCG